MARRKKSSSQAQMVPPVIQPDAAGIDIGATEIYVAVPPDRDPEPVRCFATFTSDLHALADWLEHCRVRTIAMESTGVFWIPLFQILEARKLQVCLVNARHAKNVPGRRTDVSDCQWLQYLHSCRFVAGFVSPQCGRLRCACVTTSSGQPDRDEQSPHPTHAKSSEPDESADSSCHQRHHRSDWDGHPRRHRQRPARPLRAGETERPAN